MATRAVEGMHLCKVVSGTYLVLDVFGVTDFIVMLHFGIHRMRLVVTCEEREKGEMGNSFITCGGPGYKCL